MASDVERVKRLMGSCFGPEEVPSADVEARGIAWSAMVKGVARVYVDVSMSTLKWLCPGHVEISEAGLQREPSGGDLRCLQKRRIVAWERCATPLVPTVQSNNHPTTAVVGRTWSLAAMDGLLGPLLPPPLRPDGTAGMRTPEQTANLVRFQSELEVGLTIPRSYRTYARAGPD
jgi:hypothetical protein